LCRVPATGRFRRNPHACHAVEIPRRSGALT
jgi:hypothetical protein